MQRFGSGIFRAQQVISRRPTTLLLAGRAGRPISQYAVAPSSLAQSRSFHHVRKLHNEELSQQHIESDDNSIVPPTSSPPSSAEQNVPEEIAATQVRNLSISQDHESTQDQETVAKESPVDAKPEVSLSELPLVCPGCGAYSQVNDSTAPGFYTSKREDVQLWLAKQRGIKSAEDEETDIVNNSLSNLDPSLLNSLGLEPPDLTPKQQKASTTPICGRCRALLYHNDLKQQSIIHPSINSVRAFVEESPYKKNHIYHVIDAADFPMSLIPSIANFFDISMRTRNRRAKSDQWSGGRANSMSFVITRADLIARHKAELDKMKPYLQSVLREALGKYGEKLRLGNLWCVSAKSGWWTKQLKEAVYEQGGAGWLVGKVNVGKSQLYEAIFPKGHKNDAEEKMKGESHTQNQKIQFDDSHPLLPPIAVEEKYPSMPTVSQLPGTTALPLRNFYGNGKGELIDLPGLPRDGLYEAVNPATAPYLYHGHRISAEQYTLLEGRSLLISNLIRIKSADPNLTFLAAPFVPLKCSVRDDDLAQRVLDQTQIATTAANIERTVAAPETAETITSAGRFKLETDITRAFAGPLTRRDAAGLSPSVLPFVIYGLDILIEGMGWVELSCQVRKRYIEELGDPDWRPEVEVFSPRGKFIGSRQPMGAFMRFGQRKKPVSQRSQRPRRSMKGVKKAMKRKAREERLAARSSASQDE